MSDIKIDDQTGEILFEDGELILIEGSDVIKQSLTTRLKHFRGEYFLYYE